MTGEDDRVWGPGVSSLSMNRLFLAPTLGVSTLLVLRGTECRDECCPGSDLDGGCWLVGR